MTIFNLLPEEGMNRKDDSDVAAVTDADRLARFRRAQDAFFLSRRAGFWESSKFLDGAIAALLAEVRADEREACAKLADAVRDRPWAATSMQAATAIADMIRTR